MSVNKLMDYLPVDQWLVTDQGVSRTRVKRDSLEIYPVDGGRRVILLVDGQEIMNVTISQSTADHLARRLTVSRDELFEPPYA